MGAFQIALISSAFLCSLVAGFLFAFACVVMPGIRSLSDGEFLRAFQVMDRVIQRNQPLFLFVWVGSIVATAISGVLGIWQLAGVGRLLLVIAALSYLLGVQLPTFTVNIPLNNRLQKLDLDTMDEAAQRAARRAFESRWNRWNGFRTTVASIACALMIVLLSSL